MLLGNEFRITPAYTALYLIKLNEFFCVFSARDHPETDCTSERRQNKENRDKVRIGRRTYTLYLFLVIKCDLSQYQAINGVGAHNDTQG